MYILNTLYQYTTQTLIPIQQPRVFTSNNQNNNCAVQPNKLLLKSKPSLKLPKSFAQQVMELQMLIQSGDLRNIGNELHYISRLNALYMTGIEFYGKKKTNDEKNKRKMEHFIKKLADLYMNPEVMRILQQNQNKVQSNRQKVKCIAQTSSQQTKMEVIKQKNQNNIKMTDSNPVLYLSNLKQQISKFTSQSDFVIKNMLQLSSKKQKTNFKKLQEDLSNQQNVLKNRLAQRSKKRQMSQIKKRDNKITEKTNY